MEKPSTYLENVKKQEIDDVPEIAEQKEVRRMVDVRFGLEEDIS